ncbi:MAG TPA: Ig-like domain-containing protein, partial [Longimicrobium sp.]|nr:Ig-like domain-containing protein [Longimicrobium sp.]
PLRRRTPAALTVVRAAPQGEVGIGAEVTVTFSQAMVPLSSVGTVEAREVPVRLSPRPAGSWRWLDVRTLVFTAAQRMPAATEYTVTIPAGTRSATGGVLAQAVRWTFATAPLSATGSHPHDTGIGLDPILLIQFDQRIDRAAIARRIRVQAAGRPVAVRLATAAEIAADPGARSLSQRADSATWVALRPVQPLPRDTRVEVVIPAGTTSAEGPRPTTEDQGWGFQTYGPLRMTHTGCRLVCRPGWRIALTFNNPLDTAAFDPSWVTVEPAIPAMAVSVHDRTVYIHGATQPETRYTVRVAQALRDVYGQTLGFAERRVIHVQAPAPGLLGFTDRMIVLDPAGPRRVSVVSHDHRSLRVRIHRVRPEDWPAFTENYGRRDRLPGTEVVNRVVRIDAGVGQMTETVIDLDEVLDGKPGQLVVGVESVDEDIPPQLRRNQQTYAWVQSTRIGLAAFVEPGKATAWATSLVDGASLSGLRLWGSGGGDGATDAEGVGSVILPAMSNSEWLAVRGGDDVALLPGPWYRADPTSELRFWAATDRNLYRPGEEIRFKGWVRRAGPAPQDGLALPRRLDDSVTWRAFDPRGSEIATGRAALTSLGGFDGRFALPAGANLGYGRIELTLEGQPDGGQGQAGFRVEEFRRPEYEVSAEADEGPHLAGGSAEVSVRASYFSGGALPGAPVTWRVTAQPGYFTPPGWHAWRFGVQEWWNPYDSRARVQREPERLEGVTDVQGRHAVRVHFDGPEPPH